MLDFTKHPIDHLLLMNIAMIFHIVYSINLKSTVQTIASNHVQDKAIHKQTGLFLDMVLTSNMIV